MAYFDAFGAMERPVEIILSDGLTCALFVIAYLCASYRNTNMFLQNPFRYY
jgi:hypothetical protein